MPNDLFTPGSMKDFIDAIAPVSMAVESVPANPFMDAVTSMHHWQCILQVQDRSMPTYFSKGYGHKRQPPTLSEVLDCLALDVAGVDQSLGFEEWASEYGYDTDSRKAERLYQTVVAQTRALRHLLGDDWFDLLLYQTERL